MHIYLDDNGTTTSNISANLAEAVMAAANDLFSPTGIQFYIADATRIKNDEAIRSEVSSVAGIISTFAQEGYNNVLNIHFIRESDAFGSGYAITPYYPSVPNSLWNCTVETLNSATNLTRSVAEMGIILAHELGHTLGLLHTHHPGRVASLAFNEENATISNGCYQEMQNRNRRNQWTAGCYNTDGRKKCEINGDFLCDTAGDPGQSEETNASGSKEVDPSNCQYVYNGYGVDYLRDNKGDVWNPPTTNIMSYAVRTCRDTFTPMQVGQMWYFIEEDFPFEHESQFSGHQVEFCQTGRTVTFTNPLPNMNLNWSVQPTELVHPSTRTGTGTTAFIKAANNNNGGEVWVEWQSATSCNFFSTSTPIWVGRPGFDSPYITSSNTTNFVFSHAEVAGMVAPKASVGTDSYRCTIDADQNCGSNGPRFYQNGNGTVATTTGNTISINTGTCDGTFWLRCVAINACGQTGYSSRLFRVTGSGSCQSSLQSSPNPTRGRGGVTINLIKPPDCGAYAAATVGVQEEMTVLEVTDGTGNQVYKRKASGSSQKLRVNRWKKGTYYIHAKTNTGETITQRLVIN